MQCMWHAACIATAHAIAIAIICAPAWPCPAVSLAVLPPRMSAPPALSAPATSSPPSGASSSSLSFPSSLAKAAANYSKRFFRSATSLLEYEAFKCPSVRASSSPSPSFLRMSRLPSRTDQRLLQS
eukprot:2803480-Pleurochrysis_carterae.AAC.1